MGHFAKQLQFVGCLARADYRWRLAMCCKFGCNCMQGLPLCTLQDSLACFGNLYQ